MSTLKEKISNLMEYAGVRSGSYYHASTPSTYDPDKPLCYYVDESARANYVGPHDPKGLPLYVFDDQPIYLPVFLCFYGLGQLDLYRAGRTEDNANRFLQVCRWLLENQTTDGTWLTSTPMKKFGLYRPFPSAMVQGLAISCLCRAYLLTNDTRYQHAAAAALPPFDIDVREGGVLSLDSGDVFYEEYPSYPYHHVLNGFIYAMWGLYDLVRTDNRRAVDRYERGLVTLVKWLPKFDLGYWSLYHISDGLINPATVHYHRLHVDQLDVMSALTGDATIAKYRDLWKDYSLKSVNAVRTLPHKMRWRFFYQSEITSRYK